MNESLYLLFDAENGVSSEIAANELVFYAPSDFCGAHAGESVISTERLASWRWSRTSWSAGTCSGTPSKKRVVDESLEDGHEAVTVITQETRGDLCGALEKATGTACLHRVDKQSCKPEGDLFGQQSASLTRLKAVAVVDMDHLAAGAGNHDVGRVTVTKAEDITDNAHDG